MGVERWFAAEEYPRTLIGKTLVVEFLSLQNEIQNVVADTQSQKLKRLR